MKDGLYGQYYPSNNTIIAAVKQWVTSAGGEFYKYSMQALIHLWKKIKCIANGGDTEKYHFIAENLLYQIVLFYSLYLL